MNLCFSGIVDVDTNANKIANAAAQIKNIRFVTQHMLSNSEVQQCGPTLCLAMSVQLSILRLLPGVSSKPLNYKQVWPG